MILLVDIGTRIAFYASLAIALNLVVGHSGLLLLCQSVFIGIGAYTFALCLASQFGFAVSFLTALVITVFVTTLVFLPLLRLRNDSFAIASLAVSLCFVSLLNNLDEYTNGPDGLSIPQSATILPGKLGLFGMALLVFCVITLVSWWLVRLPFGRTLHAIRSDELAAKALGKKSWTFLLRAGLISGIMSGAVGILIATYTTHVTPETFALELSVTVLAATILGGLGSSLGAVVGASATVLLPEILCSAFPALTVAEINNVVFGLFLLVALRYFPKGFMGDASLRRVLWIFIWSA